MQTGESDNFTGLEDFTGLENLTKEQIQLLRTLILILNKKVDKSKVNADKTEEGGTEKIEDAITDFKKTGTLDQLTKVLDLAFESALNHSAGTFSNLMVLVTHGADANYMVQYQVLESTPEGWNYTEVPSLLECMLSSSEDCATFIKTLITDNKVTKDHYTTIFLKKDKNISEYNPENWISYFIAIAQSKSVDEETFDEETFLDAIDNFLRLEMHEGLGPFYFFSDTSEQNHEKILVEVFNRLNNLEDKPKFLDPSVGAFIKKISVDASFGDNLQKFFKKLSAEHLDKNNNFIFKKPSFFSKFFGSSDSKKKPEPTEMQTMSSEPDKPDKPDKQGKAEKQPPHLKK